VSRLQPAPATAPGDVIDAHCHLFSLGLLQEYVEKNPDQSARFQKALKDKRFGRRGQKLPEMTAAEMAPWYAERISSAGISKALVVSVIPDSQYMRDFIAAACGHVQALCNVDPRTPEAPEVLSAEMAAGFRGVKLLPANRGFRLSDDACRPFFERAAELGVAMIVHYGVSVDPNADLRMADPLDLSPVARDFPEVTFVIAHFGAGYLGNVLKLAYQYPNICVDSSGTNNWMDFMPYPMTLAQVFETCVTALGPERVLFGTDANTMGPYREWIAYQQRRTLEEIGLSDVDRDLILRGNAVRIFDMDEPMPGMGADGE
jgi:predicted TIM-barrel fold metal-dependent hydrolase